MPNEAPEPWLRGPIPDVNPLIMPTLHALRQVSEDLHRHTAGLSDKQVWSRPHGLTSLGFHLRHIAGSLDRLTTYLDGGALDETQLDFLTREMLPGATLNELINDVKSAIENTAQILKNVDPGTLPDFRGVGRRKLPTTVIGLTVHIADHTQRHLGQAITTCQLLKAMPVEPAGE